MTRRLAIVAPSAYLLGGVQTWLDYIVPGLESYGWTVTVLLVHGVHSNAYQYLQKHPFIRSRIVENPSGSREGRVRALAVALERSDPDAVLVVNIVDAYDAVARLKIGGRRGLRVAMALHGLHGCFFEDMQRIGSSIDAVIATNRLAVEAATTVARLEPDRVFYAPCGVEIPAQSHGISAKDGLVLLFSGRFDATEKRVFDLFRIAIRLRELQVDFRLHLAGSGPDEMGLREALAPFGDQVRFFGVLEEAEMHSNFFRPGAIMMILSPSETGPLVAWEAMANSTAIVCSRFRGMGLEGGLRDGENCLCFDVGDVESAVRAILQLRDVRLRQNLIAEGRRTVSCRYTRDLSIAAWNSALLDLFCLPQQVPDRHEFRVSPSGRLDAVLGVGVAECLRNVCGIRFLHNSAGSEWPHSYGSAESPGHDAVLDSLDRPETEAKGCLV